MTDAQAQRDAEGVLDALRVEGFESEVVTTLEGTSGPLRFLQLLRIGIEKVTSFTGELTWILAWVVFALGLFNVITRYVARFIERDIIIGQIFDLQWMMFGALFLLGFNYGVREGVNPRIDFWWAEFTDKKKAWIDIVFHTAFFLPFCILAIRILYPWSMAALGRNFDGTWDTWKVWEIWEQSGDAGGLPRGPIKFLMLVGFILMATQVIAEIIKQVLVLRGRKDLAGIADHAAPLRVE